MLPFRSNGPPRSGLSGEEDGEIGRAAAEAKIIGAAAELLTGALAGTTIGAVDGEDTGGAAIYTVAAVVAS